MLMNQSVNEKEQILEMLQAAGSNATFIDDHKHGNEIEEKLEGYAVMDNYVCPIFKKATAFCLNPLYINKDTGKLHLSQRSVGGTVMTYKHATVEKAIEDFMITCVESTFAHIRNRNIRAYTIL